MFSYLETCSGPAGNRQRPGFLVPYFCLATFAGMRPAAPGGEIWKLGKLTDPFTIINLAGRVINVTAAIAKENCIRTIPIASNLGAWLERYPLSEYPIIVPNLADRVGEIRERFGLTGKDDILRHTYITAHVHHHKTIGATARAAGNSESVILKHYFNPHLMTESDAGIFWSICPQN